MFCLNTQSQLDTVERATWQGVEMMIVFVLFHGLLTSRPHEI
jgi:hypothetical protein